MMKAWAILRSPRLFILEMESVIRYKIKRNINL